MDLAGWRCHASLVHSGRQQPVAEGEAHQPGNVEDAEPVAVVIVVMGVTFLSHVVAWDGESDLLQFGLAVSLMTAVLTLFLWVAKGARAKARQAEGQEATAAPADE